MTGRLVVGLCGSRVARLAETAEALALEFDQPSDGMLSAYDYTKPVPVEAGGVAIPPDRPEAFDAERFFSDLRARKSSPGGALIVILGPLAALESAREACGVIVFVDVEERLSLLRWADLLMEAGSPGGVEALLFHESTILPQYTAWSKQATRMADLSLDDEDGPSALASKIAWFSRGRATEAWTVEATAVAEATAAAAGSETAQAGRQGGEPAAMDRMERLEAARRLTAAKLLERRLATARAPNRLALAIRAFNADRLYPAVKRSADVVLVTMVLFVAWPIYALVALLIWLDDPGPVIYTQTRIGKHGKPFPFPKFRSMVMNADKLKDKLLAQNEMTGGITFKIRRDPRIIPIGHTLRKYSFDELPQLWSIIRGDLTLVGPRPPVPREVALYSSADRRRLEAVPGLTCIWQVSGRSDIPFPRQVELDVEYLEQRSLLLDLRILLATIPAVVTGKGAY